MEPSSSTVTAPVEDVVMVDLLSRITISRSIEHTHARQGRLIPAPTTPPRLSIHFSLLTYPSQEPPNDQDNATFHRSFDLLLQEQACKREARAMLAHVAVDYVEPVNLDFIAQVFCWYTSFSVRRLHMMDVVSMKVSSIIFVRTNYSATIELLNISDDNYDDDDDDDDEDNDDDDDEDDDDEDDYFDLVVDDDNFDLVVDDDYHAYFDRGIGFLFHMSGGFGDDGSSVGDALQPSLPSGMSKEMAGTKLFLPSLPLLASSRTVW
ncbi:hypothetical protein ZIOFF_007746 [Zingiber officinale]|uniref:Uncharacterized protein n=1 Tax=Zingiber officinale TaxID=94328 RepID=A0A8J5HRR6_ZINOF|nr:hypothetical protein ZIOFF_007746 [Zingiber officinale]